MPKAGDAMEGMGASTVTMWGYYANSCTWRVRLALGLKGNPYEYKAINLSKGEQKSEEFRKISPLQYVPAVEVDGITIADSMAIIMYFEEKFSGQKAPTTCGPSAESNCASGRISDLSEQSASSEFGNLDDEPKRTQNADMSSKDQKMIEEAAGADARAKWAHDHIHNGFADLNRVITEITCVNVVARLEQLLKKVAGKYSVGDELTLADVFLVPQIGNANRFKVDLTQYPTIDRVNKTLSELPEVQASLSDNQPDAPN